MAKLYNTIFARGLAGIIYEPFEVQTRSGKAISASKAMFDDNREYMESLKQDQAAILEATTYANFAKTHDVYVNKELETGVTAYNIALADWFVTPKVLEINVDQWTGKIGQKIQVKARDNVMVAKVLVVIRDTEGKLLEMGEAVPSKTGSAWWVYTTKSPVIMTPFPTVKAIAQDLPGNSSSFTIV
jgi:hypothetical protein